MWKMWIFLASLLLLCYTNRCEEIPGRLPKFISETGEHIALVGQTVSLPCEVASLDDYVVIWKKDEDLLFADNRRLTDDSHFEMITSDPSGVSDRSNWTLLIKDVVAFNQGIYQCVLTTQPELIQEQSLRVHVAPSVNIVPEGSLFTVMAGEPIQLECYSSGNPPPTVVWTRRRHELFPNSRPQILGRTLYIENASSQYDGEYVCKADNGIQPTAEVSITVQVVYEGQPQIPPKVNITSGPIHVNVDGSFNISCKYTASSPANVEWYQDHVNLPRNIMNDKKYHIIYQDRFDYQETILFFENITVKEYTNYTCKVHNQLGEDKGVVTVTGYPVVEEFDAEEMEKGVLFSWTIDSIEPVVEYRLENKITTMGNEFENLTIQAAKFSPATTENNLTYKGSYLIDNLKADTEYEFKITAKNKNGWGDTKSIIFTTKKQEPPVSTGEGDGQKQGGGDDQKQGGRDGQKQGDVKVEDDKKGSGRPSPFGAILLFLLFSVVRFLST